MGPGWGQGKDMRPLAPVFPHPCVYLQPREELETCSPRSLLGASLPTMPLPRGMQGPHKETTEQPWQQGAGPSQTPTLPSTYTGGRCRKRVLGSRKSLSHDPEPAFPGILAVGHSELWGQNCLPLGKG